MRLGWLEIVAIIVAVILILIVTRIVRGVRTISSTNESSNKISGEQITDRPQKRTQRLRIIGIIAILIGIISLLAGVSLFKWIYWSFLLAFLAVAIGFVMVLISRKR